MPVPHPPDTAAPTEKVLAALAALRAAQRSPRRHLGWGLAVLAALGVAIGVTPELSLDCPDLNDSAYHLAIALRAREALARGDSPIDFWYPDVALGFPLLRHYQHLPHLFLVGVDRVVGRWLPMQATYRVVLGALLVLFPLAMYRALRRCDCPPLVAGCAALVAPLLSTPHLYGLSFESYLWGGSGLYAQLFASVLAPLAIAAAYRAVSTGRGVRWAALLSAATFVSQLVYGYIVALSTLALVPFGPQRGRRFARAALVLTGCFLIGSYFFVPALRDAELANRSVWEKPEKWNSLGAPTILRYLATGELLDHGRPPVVTAFVGLGLLCALGRRDRLGSLFAGLFVLWLLLYFGRPTWGRLLDVLPAAYDLPLHRLIGGVHLFAIPLAGYGLAFVVDCIATPRHWLRTITAAVTLALLLSPALAERAAYLQKSRRWKADAHAALQTNTDWRELLTQLRALGGGRCYVGIPGRAPEYLRVGGIPLTALCLLDGIDTLGFLWIAITWAGDVQVWFDPDNPVHCRTFGVRYLVFEESRPPPPSARLLNVVGKYRVYQTTEASYFGVVDVPFAVRCTKRSVYEVGRAWLESGFPAADRYPALHIDGHGPANMPPVEFIPEQTFARPLGGPPMPAGRIVRAQDTWSCDVELTRPAAVVRRAGYHAGLRATVDGQPAQVFPVTPGFAAVQVPAGSHIVQFRYEPARRWPWAFAGLAAFALVGSIAPRSAGNRTAPRKSQSPGPGTAA
jgi:hypothetical protein